MGRGLQLASGQVIALGRLLVAALFLAALSIDKTQSGPLTDQVFALMIAYSCFAAVLVAVTWSSWWFDANLAGPAHAIDIALFTAVVFLTPERTGPFFTFFIFVMLSAAIRWGWRATALTAVLLILLYVLVGLLALSADQQPELLITRTGYLVIFSLILIWFGMNQWRARLHRRTESLLTELPLDSKPLETSLGAAMTVARASAGAFAWSKRRRVEGIAIVMRDSTIEVLNVDAASSGEAGNVPFLYDLPKGRALMRDSKHSLRVFAPDERIREGQARLLGLRSGLAIPVASERGEGQIFLENISGLSTDHLGIGAEIAAAIAAHMQRHALMKAAEENAESRSRLSVARDLHDSVVQFLAGAAFRLEAMKRSEESGRGLGPELNELKELMMLEQSELRSFISALRSGSQIGLAEVANDLHSLASRLSRQWSVQCTFSFEPADILVPTRLHLDAQQLAREAVANAVRHAGAKTISIRLSGASDALTLDFINDGASYAKAVAPSSLKDRVDAAHGKLELSRGMGVTKISISLPFGGRTI